MNPTPIEAFPLGMIAGVVVFLIGYAFGRRSRNR
jgi:hypothetical protein